MRLPDAYSASVQVQEKPNSQRPVSKQPRARDSTVTPSQPLISVPRNTADTHHARGFKLPCPQARTASWNNLSRGQHHRMVSRVERTAPTSLIYLKDVKTAARFQPRIAAPSHPQGTSAGPSHWRAR